METSDTKMPAAPALKVTPYPYQAEGIAFGLAKRRFLIGDEPGLGKTLQSIGVAEAAGAYPCLVICPASLKINWQREFEKFTDAKALVLDNSTLATWPYLLRMGMFQVAIVNYESLRKYFVVDTGKRREFRLKDVTFTPHIKMFRSVIIDESHRVKDPSAQQTIFTKGICAGKPYIMLLSGTPVLNRPADLIAQLSIMERLNEFGGKRRFLADYGGGDVVKGDGPRRDDDEPRNLRRLSAELYKRCLIRRCKADVLPQLPDKTRVDLYVEISNGREYAVAAADLAEYLRSYRACTDAEIRRKMRMAALVKFMTLRGLSSRGKVARVCDFAETFLANGRPLILFCSLHEVVDAIKARFPGAVCITGRESAATKQAAVDAFQSGKVQLAICSIKAAGVGLTLTAASDVAFAEFPWTYADCCQCEDRAHRIGQKDNVTCYYLIGRNTIDSTLYSIIQDKKSVACRIMGTDDDVPTDEIYFNEFTEKFLSEYGDSPH